MRRLMRCELRNTPLCAHTVSRERGYTINFGDGLLYSEIVLVKGIGKIEVTGDAGDQHRPPQPNVDGMLGSKDLGHVFCGRPVTTG